MTFDEFVRRAAQPNDLDIAFGVMTILLVLEATRRTVGWILPAVVIGFLLYAYFGGELPATWQIPTRATACRGSSARATWACRASSASRSTSPRPTSSCSRSMARCSSTRGREVLPRHLARRDRPLAHRPRAHDRAGRLPARHGVGLGRRHDGHARHRHLADPASRGGYPKEEGGGVLAASGIGAILSPPTLGAAAFIIAEFLKVSYLTVLLYAVIPSLLYYLGILLAIEADARRFDTEEVDRRVAAVQAPAAALRLPLLVAVRDRRAARGRVLAVPLRALRDRARVPAVVPGPDHRMAPMRVFEALAAGARAVLPVAATCAAAGIIVAVVTLTGLGLNLSGIIIDVAGGSLFLCALLAAIAVLLLGLAVPVTASFIIAAVIVSPALTKLGVEPLAAYMFIFYYAVLSEVSPPTALSAVAAAAITGGNAFRTMMLTWKYTLPAFLVPFAFVLTDNGEGLLLQGSVGTVVLAFAVSALAVGGARGGDGRVDARARAAARAGAVRRGRARAALPRAAVDRDRPRALRRRRRRPPVGRRQAPSGLRSAEG